MSALLLIPVLKCIHGENVLLFGSQVPPVPLGVYVRIIRFLPAGGFPLVPGFYLGF